MAQELSESLQIHLQAISEQDAPQKLVLFVDGLDEGIGKTISILRFIPTSKSWLSVLCASRQVPDVETWHHQRASRQGIHRPTTLGLRYPCLAL